MTDVYEGEVEIRQIHDPSEMVALWSDLLKIEHINTSPAMTLARCLAGDFVVLSGYFRQDWCGFAVCSIQQTDLTMLVLYLPRKTRLFMTAFDTWCRARGIKRILSLSTRNPEAYSKLTHMQPLYTVFSKEVN